jgi:hypothetical protein
VIFLIKGVGALYTQKWQDILNKIDDFARNTEGNIWFRGQSMSKHELHSGLFRLNIPEGLSNYLKLEVQLYRYYQNLGHLLHGEERAWNLLYSMQHHGVKTRLLDWTESFSVALFFATDGWRKDKARIWLLSPIILNEIAIGKKEIISPKNIFTYPDFYQDSSKEIPTIAIYPIKNNERIIAQHGVFTVQGNSLLPLEKEFSSKLVRAGGLNYIDLCIDVREDSHQFLSQNGINYFSAFPDQDGLSHHINKLLIEESWLE